MVVRADQIRPGHIVEYHGVRHVVSEIRRPSGAAWPVACDGTGWAIALGTQQFVVSDGLLAA